MVEHSEYDAKASTKESSEPKTIRATNSADMANLATGLHREGNTKQAYIGDIRSINS